MERMVLAVLRFGGFIPDSSKDSPSFVNLWFRHQDVDISHPTRIQTMVETFGQMRPLQGHNRDFSSGQSVPNVPELGVHFLYDFVHHLEEDVHGGVLGWLLNTAASAVLGIIVGAVVVAVAHGRKKH